MQDFMKHDFTVEKIELACHVAAGKSAPVHVNRKSHGLAIFPGGEKTIVFGEKKLSVGKDAIVYFPKGSSYTVKEKVPFECYAINFQLAGDEVFQPFAVTVKNANACLQSFKESQRLWLKKGAGYSAKIKSELYHILYQLQSEYEIPYARTAVIEPAVAYVHSHYDKEQISVSHLAALCGISQVYLRNLFLKRFAMTPVKYINHLRLTRASELLASQMYAVRDACFLSGFQDESYFSREFKKNFGISPKEYAKASRI